MEKLSKKEIWGYACGNLAQNLCYMMVSVYLLYFYTDVLKIAAASVSVLFLVMRIFDALNDPLMGYLADKTNSRWGRFRPYILFGSVPLAVITVLLFTVPPFGQTGKTVWAYITYLLYGIIFTIVLIPYFAMPASMTQNPEERSRISSACVILSTIAALIVSAAVSPLVGLFSSEKIGFPVVTACFGLIAVICFYICFKSSKERIPHQSENDFRFRDVFVLLGKNTPLIIVSLGYIFYSIMYTIRMAVVAYYTKYYMNNEAMTTIVLVMAIAGSLVGTALAVPLQKKFGKRNAYIIGAVIGAVSCFIMYFVSGDNVPAILILSVISQMGMAFPLVITWSMAPDTVDYSEWKTGIRAEGTMFGAFSFIQKFASAIAGSLSALILAATGYVPDGVQNATAIKGILSMMTTIPAVCCVLCIICILFYRLDSGKMETILADLSSRKAKA